MAEQRIALVTGGNRGIGLELCRQLGQQRIRVILCSRDAAKGVAAAAELKANGLPVEPRQLDVANVQSIRECMNWVRREVGRLDVLINNAGIMVEDDDADSLEELEIVRDTMQTNVYGPLLLSRLAIPIMKTRRYGRIVNLSSILGSITYQATPGSPTYGFSRPSYNVSKAAVNAYTVQLAYQLKDTKIKVNAAHPGWRSDSLSRERRRNPGMAGDTV